MDGFQSSADFAFLRGLEVEQVCLGQYQTWIHFHPQGRISMEGRYVHEITSENRQLIQPRSSCGPNELYRLLGQSVTDAVVLSESILRPSLSNGDTLTLIDHRSIRVVRHQLQSS
jgi:hypothetical protein